MKRYKISKENLHEFWGWFGKKKPMTLQTVIDNDPVLKQLDKEIGDINNKYIPKLKKFRKEDPENFYRLVKAGVIDLDDLK